MSRAPMLLYARYLLRRAGWPLLLGVVLFSTAAVMEFVLLPEAQEKLAGLRTATVKARAQRNAAGPGTTDATNLLAALPAREALEGNIAVIHQLAAAQGLASSGGEYRSRKEAGGEILHYEMMLPLKGAYAPLRAWLAELKTHQPAISIDELSLHRTSAEQGQLEGRLRLSLFLRSRPAAMPAATPNTTSDVRHTATGSANAVSPAPTFTVPHFAAASGELFATRSWQPPPPPAAPPPPHKAPPLTLKYAGKLVEEKLIRIFLTQGTTTSLVAQGDQIGNYDIERITTTSVTLVYRPLNEKQTLNFGGYD